MATHASILAWRTPWTEEPGGLQSTGWQRVRHDRVTSLSLSFTMLVIAFFSRRKHLLISWLQSPSAVIFEPKKIKSVTVSIVSPSICQEVIAWRIPGTGEPGGLLPMRSHRVGHD